MPVFDTVAEAVDEAGANTTLIFVPARFAADAIYEAVDAGIETVDLHHRAHPRARDAARLHVHPPAGRDADRPELPGRALAGQGERRDHPGRGLQRGDDRARLALGDADLPDRPRAGPARARQLDDRRHRRRPGRRLVVHRRAREVRGRPRDRVRRARRRDRRRRGGEGGALHRRADVEAGLRLHRRLLGAARQDDGPRGRDHLRLVRHRAGEEGGARGRRASRSARRRPRSPQLVADSRAAPEVTRPIGRGSSAGAATRDVPATTGRRRSSSTVATYPRAAQDRVRATAEATRCSNAARGCSRRRRPRPQRPRASSTALRVRTRPRRGRSAAFVEPTELLEGELAGAVCVDRVDAGIGAVASRERRTVGTVLAAELGRSRRARRRAHASAARARRRRRRSCPVAEARALPHHVGRHARADAVARYLAPLPAGRSPAG